MVGENKVTVLTNNSGEDSIGTTHSPFQVEEMLQVEKSGYQRYSKPFSSSVRLRELDVILRTQYQCGGRGKS
jgi:hypothetical protein